MMYSQEIECNYTYTCIYIINSNNLKLPLLESTLGYIFSVYHIGGLFRELLETEI